MKLLYGQAFRAPNAYELFWRQDDVAKPNPVLRPETNSTSEFVLEQALTSAVRVGVTAFHYRVDDLISQQTDPFDDLLVYNNVDRIDARGLELEAEGKWSSGLLARTSYTYQNSRNHVTHQPLTNSPAHVAQALVLAPLGRPGLSAGFETSYLSERRTLAGTVCRPPCSPISQCSPGTRSRAWRSRRASSTCSTSTSPTRAPRNIARTASSRTAARSASTCATASRSARGSSRP